MGKENDIKGICFYDKNINMWYLNRLQQRIQ